MSSQRRVMVLYFHPAQKTSRVGNALAACVKDVAGVTFRDMYGLYPDFLIDVIEEQKFLEQHDVIIFQHPVYWYSCPPLLKLWIDEVFEYGWAYGSAGTKLQGKVWLSAVSAGGSSEAYTATGSNRFDLKTFFSPFDQTATLCGMKYANPFVVHGARGLSEMQVKEYCERYRNILLKCIEGGDLP